MSSQFLEELNDALHDMLEEEGYRLKSKIVEYEGNDFEARVTYLPPQGEEYLVLVKENGYDFESMTVAEKGQAYKELAALYELVADVLEEEGFRAEGQEWDEKEEIRYTRGKITVVLEEEEGDFKGLVVEE